MKTTYFTDQDVADIIFARPIDTKTTSKIRFDSEGKGEWLNDTTYRFKPTTVKPLQPATADERRRHAGAELRKAMRREMEQRFAAVRATPDGEAGDPPTGRA